MCKRMDHSIDDYLGLVHAHEAGIFTLAQERGIDPLTLRSQLLLHLPRSGDFQQEALKASKLVTKKQHPYAHWIKPPENPVTLDDLEFGPLDADTAKIYHENFHYVGSYRPGHYYAFRIKGSDRIVCMGSVANFDLKHVEEKIAAYINPQSVLMFSRFFAFRWAPKNIFSYFWGKLRQQLIKEHNTKLMFSFINPNLGFDARSHKAAQWQDFAYEEATQYMYLDEQYRTMRFFVENFGTNDPIKLKAKLGASFEMATMQLHPLQILANTLQQQARIVIPTIPYLFQRPKL